MEFFSFCFTRQVTDGDQDAAAASRLFRAYVWPYEALGAGGTGGLDDSGGTAAIYFPVFYLVQLSNAQL